MRTSCYGPYIENEQLHGAFISLEDANDKIIDIWMESDYYGAENYADALDKVDADGRISWTDVMGEGAVFKAWMKKHELVEKTRDEVWD